MHILRIFLSIRSLVKSKLASKVHVESQNWPFHQIGKLCILTYYHFVHFLKAEIRKSRKISTLWKNTITEEFRQINYLVISLQKPLL